MPLLLLRLLLGTRRGDATKRRRLNGAAVKPTPPIRHPFRVLIPRSLRCLVACHTLSTLFATIPGLNLSTQLAGCATDSGK